MLERELYNWFAEDDKFVTIKDVYAAFPNESKTNIQKALDNLCARGTFYKVSTIVGDMYGIDSAEEDDSYAVDTSTGSGMGDILRAMGVFDDYVPLSRGLIKETIPNEYDIDEINDDKYRKESYSPDDVLEWMNTIGENRQMLTTVKQYALQQLVQYLQGQGLGDKLLYYFEGLAKIELEEIAKERENHYKKIVEIWNLMKDRLTDKRMLSSVSDELVKMISDVEDMTINGGQLYFSVPINNADYYRDLLNK